MESSLPQERSSSRKFNVALIWNLASLAILALVGIVINTLIARWLDATALGVFNQIYAIFVFASQLGVGGIHLSTFHYISHAQDNRALHGPVATSALVSTAVLSAAVCLVAYAAHPLIALMLDSEAVATGVVYALPGLFFFALNKVLLSILNGLQHMRAYAVLQAFRFVLLLLAIVGLLVTGASSAQLGWSFSIAESVLFFAALLYVARQFPLPIFRVDLAWAAKHVSYGFRGMLGGVFTEINTRVDVIMLGIFVSDAAVGLYSFAAILAEGFSQVGFVLRRNIDPLLGRHFSRKEPERIELLARKTKRIFFPGMLLIGSIAVLLYPYALSLVIGDDSFAASSSIFSILMLGVVANSLYRPFAGILLQAGHPGRNTMLIAVIVSSNVLLNLTLIPVFGPTGAAASTALAYGLEAILIALTARRFLGIKI